MFDKYFTLAVADNDISQAELDNLLVLTGDASGFMEACTALKKRGLLKVAFDRLEAYKEHVPLENMTSLIHALCDLCDTLPVKARTFLDTDVETLAYRLGYFGLKREQDRTKRCAVLREAISRSTGLTLPLHIVSNEVRDDDRESDRGEFLVEEKDLQTLKAICVEKLRAASETREFRHNPRLDEYLWRWSEWTSAEEVRSWIAAYTRKPKGAVWLLTVLLGESHSWGAEHRMRYYIDLRTIERFTDLSKLTELVDQVDVEGLPVKQARAVQEYRNALRRRMEGKSDEAWHDERNCYEVVAD